MARLRLVDTLCQLSASYASVALQYVDGDGPVGVGITRTDEFSLAGAVEGDKTAEASPLALKSGIDSISVIGDGTVEHRDDLNV